MARKVLALAAAASLAALSLGACAHTPPTSAEDNARLAAWRAKNDADWRVFSNCQTHETNEQCSARNGDELRAKEAARNADPAYQAQQAQRAQMLAQADAQCRFAAQQAYMQADLARPSILGLEATGYRNLTYRSCMQAHGYSIPGGSGGPAPTLSDVFSIRRRRASFFSGYGRDGKMSGKVLALAVATLLAACAQTNPNSAGTSANQQWADQIQQQTGALSEDARARWQAEHCSPGEEYVACSTRVAGFSGAGFERQMAEAQRQAVEQAQADWIARQQQLALCTAAADYVALSINNFWGGLAAGLATGSVCMGL